MGKSVFERECNKIRLCTRNSKINISNQVMKHSAFDGTLNKLSESLLNVPNGQKLDFIWRSAYLTKNLINPIKVSRSIFKNLETRKLRTPKMRIEAFTSNENKKLKVRRISRLAHKQVQNSVTDYNVLQKEKGLFRS